MTTIVPEGDLVSAGAAKLRQSLYDAITNDPGGLTVDLANVRIVDSVGLGVLVAAHNTLGRSGASLCLVNVSSDIFALLKAMRLEQHFSISMIS